MLQLLLLGVLGLLVIFVIRQVQVLGRGGIDIRTRRTGRLCALVLVGVLLGVGVHSDYARKREGGRETFLAGQAHRFDNFISKPHGLVPMIVTSVLLTGAAVGAYELIAWALYLAIKPARKKSAGERDLSAEVPR
jgi:hypothetical protein